MDDKPTTPMYGEVASDYFGRFDENESIAPSAIADTSGLRTITNMP